MRVSDVGDLVQEWVNEHGQHLPGFSGAYLFGSLATMSGEAMFATYRDVDLIVVLDSGTKQTDDNLEVPYKGLMLEVGFIGLDEHRDAEVVLARPDRAGSLARTRILADPLGFLAPLQREVARRYAERRWVEARCEAEKRDAREALQSMGQAPAPYPRLFALVGTIFGLAGLLAVARLKMPTSRRALSGMQSALESEGRPDLYAGVLDVCGVAGLTLRQVQGYHAEMLRAFDRAVEVRRTFVPYSFKVQPHLRPYVDEAIAELITEGHHREAAFFLTLPYSTVNAILQKDASEQEKPGYQAGFDGLLDGLD